ncbi:MAG: DUF3999 family protein [Candidatus Acidiferrales bacterium]
MSGRRGRRGGFAVAAMGAAFLALATAFAALAAGTAGPLPAAWKHWHYWRAIEVAPADAAQLASVVAPLDAYAHAHTGLRDLRVIDDQGTEIPYVIFRRLGTATSASLPSSLRENSFSAGAFTQLVLDAGRSAPFHNAVRIQTGAPDFIEWVQVEASDDGHVWRMVQERAPIFRFRKEGHEGTQLVHYSENNAQYLRVRILDGDKRFPATGAEILHETAEPAERVPMETALVADAKQPAGRSAWSAEVGPAVMLVTEVKFEVSAPPEFIRSVEIASSANGKDGEIFHNGEIYRYRQGDAEQEQLAVFIPNGWVRTNHLRVEIVNRNDAPLIAATPKLYMTPQHVVFEQQPGRSYRLIYGQERAERAQYDLGRRVDATQMAAALAGELGPEEVNADWVDPRPWTETHDIFLWMVMLIAVVLLGYAAVQSLRRSAAMPEA